MGMRAEIMDDNLKKSFYAQNNFRKIGKDLQ